MKSRWGLVLPGQLMLVEEKGGKGGKETPRPQKSPDTPGSPEGNTEGPGTQ